MMFGTIICKVETTFIPIEAELALCCAAAEPVEAHPKHFDVAVDDGVVDESRGSRVVSLNG